MASKVNELKHFAIIRFKFCASGCNQMENIDGDGGVGTKGARGGNFKILTENIFKKFLIFLI